LQVGLVGGAILAIAGLGIGAFPGDKSVRTSGALASITPAQWTILVAVAARVLNGTSADPKVIATRVDEALRHAPIEVRKDIGTALTLLENGLRGLLFQTNPQPFTLMNVDAQDAALHAWRDSRIVLFRSAYHGIRKLCLAAHYATPQAWPELAYPGPSIPKADPASISARAPLQPSAASEGDMPPSAKGG
jgi:hypothetical protein